MRKAEKAAEATAGDAHRMSRHLIGLSTAMRARVRVGLLDRGHDLSPSSTQVVPNLPEEGLGMSELAARLRLTLQRTGQLVQQLEDDGYVERTPDERDGRAKRVVYAKRGLELLRDIEEITGEIAAEFASILGTRRYEALCRDLEILDTAINGPDAALRLVTPRS